METFKYSENDKTGKQRRGNKRIFHYFTIKRNYIRRKKTKRYRFRNKIFWFNWN